MLERPMSSLPKPRRDAKFSTSSRHQKPQQRPEGHASSSSTSSSPPPPLACRAPPPPHPACSTSPSTNAIGGEGNLDRVLFDNFVEMVPLIETLMGQRANSSFRRRASVIYTPAPSKHKKAVGNKSLKSSSAKKRREDNLQGKQMVRDKQDVDDDEFSIMSSRPLVTDCTLKDKEEMDMLREQVEDLNKNLIEKDEKLKVVESSLSELKREMVEKDALIKSAHSQLNNAKMKLADKQASLEKIEWEAREENKNNMKLQGKLDRIDFEFSSFMKLFLALSEAPTSLSFEDNMSYTHNFDQLPNLDVDESALEEASVAYLHALAAAKENPCDEMLRVVSEARSKFQSFVL